MPAAPYWTPVAGQDWMPDESPAGLPAAEPDWSPAELDWMPAAPDLTPAGQDWIPAGVPASVRPPLSLFFSRPTGLVADCKGTMGGVTNSAPEESKGIPQDALLHRLAQGLAEPEAEGAESPKVRVPATVSRPEQV